MKDLETASLQPYPRATTPVQRESATVSPTLAATLERSEPALDEPLEEDVQETMSPVSAEPEPVVASTTASPISSTGVVKPLLTPPPTPMSSARVLFNPIFDFERDPSGELLRRRTYLDPAFPVLADVHIQDPIDGRVRDLVEHPGVSPLAHKWAGDASRIQTIADLPRVHPIEFDDVADDFKEINLVTRTKRVAVCLYNRNPRQRSLWTSGVLSMHGSGKYRYVEMQSTDCQHEGTCLTHDASRAHPQCDPSVSPVVGLVEWIKCCGHERYEVSLHNQAYDVAVGTGDEYCRSHNASGPTTDFRFYFDSKTPLEKQAVYLPLGPREEFRRVLPRHQILATKRKYAFNFIGSITSASRRLLAQVLRYGGYSKTGFVHIIEEWKRDITRSNGYILPSDYRRVLIDSVFTLCPDGHNPEAYRIWEACEAGSVPVIALDETYQLHECGNAYAPLIRAGAPFVFLNGWRGLGPYLARIGKNPEVLLAMQADVMDWYAKYMKSIASKFEKVLEDRFVARTKRKPDESADSE